MVFGILASAVTSLAAFAFPTFASYKAIKANDVSQMVPWLMFWSVQASLSFAEHWLYLLLQWVPLYKECKMFFTLWLVLPQTQGASYLYLSYLHPSLEAHERDLDKLIISLHKQIRDRGGYYVELLVSRLYEFAFGSARSLHVSLNGPAVSTAGTSSRPQTDAEEGYVASLFSRFKTVPFGSAPDIFPATLMNVLGTASTRGTDIIPANLSPEERSKYVNKQKAKLQELLHLLEAAERSYPPVNVRADQTGASEINRRNPAGASSRLGSRAASGAITPSQLDSDYEDLGTDDISSKTGSPTPKSSAGWFWKSRTE